MPMNFRGIINFLGQTKHGSSGSYTQFAKDGRQTMTGTAKVYKDLWIPATSWLGIAPGQFANPYNANFTSAGSTSIVATQEAPIGPAAGSPALIPVMSASAAANEDSRMATVFLAPADAATTGSVEVTLYFSTLLAMATTGSMQVYRLHYCYVGAAGSPELGNGGSILYAGSMATTGSGKLEIWDLGDINSFSVASSPLVFMQLTLEQSSASGMAGSAEDFIYGVNLRYVSDNLGVQVT